MTATLDIPRCFTDQTLSVALDGAGRDSYLATLQSFLDENVIRHFRAYEINNVGRKTLHRDSRDVVSLLPAKVELWPHIIPTLHVAEWLRAQFGNNPIDVTSGYRDPWYNDAVGGADHSLHVAFNAIDLLPRGADPVDVGQRLLLFPSADKLGIGVYRTFVHIDTRGMLGRRAPARWSGSGVSQWW